MWINGAAAPLAYVSPAMVRAQVPLETDSETAEIVVETAAGRSAPRIIRIEPSAAAILAPARLRVDGKQFAAAEIAGQDAYALPEGAVADLASRPARPGETLVLYGIGFGEVTPRVATGEIAPAETHLASQVEVRIGGMPAEVVYAGLSPGRVGLYELRVTVPPLAEDGPARLEVLVNGRPAPQELYVAVSQ